ncbi:MAG: hypothetical protein P8P30_06090 [Rickettsiales bacterium]|nr:hypothetical protein [Rickettsiales bacterium]
MMADEKKTKKKKKKSSFKSKILWFIVLVGTFALLRQTTMLLLVGMLPTLVVKFIDDSDEQLWFKTVFCFNLAGVFPYLIDITMTHGNSVRALQEQMADSFTWLSAYGGAAAGYAVMIVCPMASEFFMRVFNTKRIEKHHKKLVRLHEEWGVGDKSDL